MSFAVCFGNINADDGHVWDSGLRMELDPLRLWDAPGLRAWVEDERDRWMLDGGQWGWFDTAAGIANSLAGGYGWAEFHVLGPDGKASTKRFESAGDPELSCTGLMPPEPLTPAEAE